MHLLLLIIIVPSPAAVVWPDAAPWEVNGGKISLLSVLPLPKFVYFTADFAINTLLCVGGPCCGHACNSIHTYNKYYYTTTRISFLCIFFSVFCLFSRKELCYPPVYREVTKFIRGGRYDDVMMMLWWRYNDGTVCPLFFTAWLTRVTIQVHHHFFFFFWGSLAWEIQRHAPPEN